MNILKTGQYTVGEIMAFIGWVVRISTILIFGWLISMEAVATEYHHDRRVYNETLIEQSITKEVNRSALGIIDLHFNLATKDIQWAAGAATIDGDGAGKFGIGKRLDNVFVSGTVAREDGHTGFSMSVSGKF